MRPYLLLLCALAFPLLGGCVTVDHAYSITIQRPNDEVCFIEMQWQTRFDSRDEATWKTETQKLAGQAIKSELIRRGFPSGTVVIESSTSYRGDWVVVRASSGNLPQEQLQAKVKEILAAIPRGQRPPGPVYRGKGEFHK
jgi:hypothetical protein